MMLSVLSMLCVFSSHTHGIPVNVAVNVIVDIYQQFNSDGVYVLGSCDWLAEAVGQLSRDYVATAVVNEFPRQRFWSLLFVLCSADITALQQLSTDVNTEAFVWLLFLDDRQLVDEFFQGVYVPFDCRLLVAHAVGALVQLTEVYHVSRNHPLSKHELGIWSDGVLTVYNTNLYDGRNNLQGLVMQAVSMNSLPYSAVNEINGTTSLGGSLALLWSTLEKKLNFTTEYLPSQESFAGSRVDDGSWTGLIGRLQRKEADVAIAATTMTPRRAAVVDFSAPIFITSYRVFIKKPRTLDIDWGNFWAPFELRLWIVVLLIVFAASVVVEACHKLFQRFACCSQEQHYQPFLIDSVFYVFGAFCNQGQDMRYRCMSVRAGFLVVHFTAVVILAAYSAGLISSLTIETLNLPFTNLEELLASSTYMIGVANKSSGIGLFNQSRHPLMKEIYEKLMLPDPKNFPDSTLEGLERVCSMKFAFVAQVSRVEAILDQVPCEILDLPHVSLDVNLAIAFSKGNPYRGIINYNLQALRAGGILHRIQPKEASELRLGVKSALDSLNLGDAAPILTVWATSILVGLCLLFIERKARRLLIRRSYMPNQNDFPIS